MKRSRAEEDEDEVEIQPGEAFHLFPIRVIVDVCQTKAHIVSN